MKVIPSVNEMSRFSDAQRQKGETIAFVPTMGFLHKGHLTLMEEGKRRADHLVASIFVNPAQFGPNEDYGTYPRALEQDLELCRDIGVSAVFTPNTDAMYPDGFQTYVELEKLPNHLCGLSRPVFFRGVATVVTKLFNIVKPHISLFGEKDFQQLAVIRQMVKDLCFDMEIVGVPIVREEDGLAMSSRNKYLTPEERPHALLLHKSLLAAKEMIVGGETDPRVVAEKAKAILSGCPDINIDYVSICDPLTLDEVETIQAQVVMAIAVWLGKTRLIDNMVFG